MTAPKLLALTAGAAYSLLLPTVIIAQSVPTGRTLPADTRFYTPPPASGSMQQAFNLLTHNDIRDAALITAMVLNPQAVWLTGGAPSEVSATVTGTLEHARGQRAVPTFVLYNVPGRDCGSYSAGGAQDTPTYQAWIKAIAAAIGDQKAVVLVEPDSLANLPSDCGYDPGKVNIAQATADRYAQIQFAAAALEAQSQTLVYLDAGSSLWRAVGDIAGRLSSAGVFGVQGFFSNVSNFRLSSYETHFDTWVSECLAFATNAQDGGWRLGHYDYCASQYYSPLGPVDATDIATWIYTDQWYAQSLGAAVPAAHFVVDTSRNGQGPLAAGVYVGAPYNQPAPDVQTIANGSWCNPPARGLGQRSTADTGVPLLDAYLWVKTPGQSDGTCDAAGGARAWDYSLYTQPGWPTDPAIQAAFDPLWGLADPAAGAWFPQQAVDLARRANPPLLQF